MKRLLPAVALLLFSMVIYSCRNDKSTVIAPLVRPALVSIVVSPINPSIAMGATRQFKATGRHEDGSTSDLTSSVTWTSTDQAKATINAAGKVTLLAQGQTVIGIVMNGFTDETTLTVRSRTNAVNLAQTRQVTVYAAADDGSLKRGVDWPDSRFTNHGDGTVTDTLTGLVWPRNSNVMPAEDPNWDQDHLANDGAVTWQHALDYVAKLNTDNYLGHNDWRLPNSKELKSLIDHGRYNPALPSGHPFLNVQADDYWTSTSLNVGVPIDVWTVGMRDGRLYGNLKISYQYVWPVRSSGSAPAEPAKTGQTKCYDDNGAGISCANTGQDGDRQAGVAWPGPRFTEIESDTMTDNLTGLVWVKDGNVMPTRDNNWDQDDTVNDGSVTWQHALDYVAKLNRENYLGHGDWRLPNIHELESLFNAGHSEVLCSMPSTSCATNDAWLNSQGFSNAQFNYYWSSTTLNPETSRAWQLNLAMGHVFWSDKGSTLTVWPVRSGQ
jgi:hypothetical protein